MQSRVRNNRRINPFVLANYFKFYKSSINFLCSACDFKIQKPLPQKHKKPVRVLEELYKTPRESSQRISEVLQEAQPNHVHSFLYSGVWQTMAQKPSLAHRLFL